MESAAGLAYDDVGARRGRPIVYLHGTPDSRLARPDDALTLVAGVRLLAVDRPGYGGTAASTDLGAGLAGLLDALSLDHAGLLAWSGGALGALRAAADPALAGRLSSLTIVAGLAPSDAYDDEDVRAAAPERLGLLELAETMPPAEVAAMAAPMLAPHPCDLALAREHQREQRDPADQAVLESVPGAVDQMALALVEAVRHGLAGVEADVIDQIQPLGPDLLARVILPVSLVYGSADRVAPAAFGHWYARALPHATLEVMAGAGHFLPFTHWTELLGEARGTAPPG